MPANGRGLALKVQATDSATENIPPGGFVRQVRVKRCGKSAPRPEQSGWQGKPHVEQDQIGEEERPAPLQLPGRLLEPVSNGRSRRMVAARSGGYRNRLIDRAGSSFLVWFDRSSSCPKQCSASVSARRLHCPSQRRCGSSVYAEGFLDGAAFRHNPPP